MSSPPSARARPSASRVKVNDVRGAASDPVALHLPVVGSYSSAADTEDPVVAFVSRLPPATSTLPLLSSVAAAEYRGVSMLPVGDQVPVAGSYSSALAVEASVEGSRPPATRTLPSSSCVTVGESREMDIDPVAVHVRVAGSYSSALAKTVLPLMPPITRTFPVLSRMALWPKRGVVMSPTAVSVSLPLVPASTSVLWAGTVWFGDHGSKCVPPMSTVTCSSVCGESVVLSKRRPPVS